MLRLKDNLEAERKIPLLRLQRDSSFIFRFLPLETELLAIDKDDEHEMELVNWLEFLVDEALR